MQVGLRAAALYGGGWGGGGSNKQGRAAQAIRQASQCRSLYSELTKTSTALARLAVMCVLSAARRLVLILVNPLYVKR